MTLLWHQVPMPPNIANLPRTPSGMPVVFITEYETNGVENHTRFVDLMPGKGKLDCDCEFGVGRARIGRQCPRRQAQAVLDRRCAVCGVHIRPGKEMVFVGVAPSTRANSGEDVYMTVEAGVHHDCATYSLLACPAMHDRPDVQLAFAREFDLFARVHTKGDPFDDTYYTVPHDQIQHVPGRAVIGMYAMVFPASVKLMTSSQWLQQGPPLTRPGLKAVMPTAGGRP